MKYTKNKIWLTTNKTKFCIVRVYSDKTAMRAAYKEFRPNDKNHDTVLGAHCGYEKIIHRPNKRKETSQETGTVFLSKENCTASIVAHELMHAVIWAKTHKKNWKEQYPFIIDNIKSEEQLLHNLSYSLNQFYNFYWEKVDPHETRKNF